MIFGWRMSGFRRPKTYLVVTCCSLQWLSARHGWQGPFDATRPFWQCVVCQAVGPPQREYVVFGDLNRELVWKTKFFKVHESQTMRVALLPGRILVDELPLAEWPYNEFWPSVPPRAPRASRKRRRVQRDEETPAGEVDPADEVRSDASEAGEGEPNEGAEYEEDVFGNDDEFDLSDHGSSSDPDGSGEGPASVTDAEVSSDADGASSSSSSSDSSSTSGSLGEEPTPVGGGISPDAPAADGGDAMVALERVPPATLPCWVRCEVPGHGSIVWYRSNGNFVASCSADGHEGISLCKKTRTSWASDRRPAQGRPLGHLMAWLVAEGEQRFSGRRAHHSFVPSLAQRVAGREALKALPDSALLFVAEREKRDGEDSEPEGLA